MGCPYSDHSFTVGEIQLISSKPKLQSFWSRSYSEKNMLLIEEQILNIDFSSLNKLNYSNGKWEYLKTSIISILDKIAPLKKVSIQEENKFPWFDLELYKVRHLRNVLYERLIRVNFSRIGVVIKQLGIILQN